SPTWARGDWTGDEFGAVWPLLARFSLIRRTRSFNSARQGGLVTVSGSFSATVRLAGAASARLFKAEGKWSRLTSASFRGMIVGDSAGGVDWLWRGSMRRLASLLCSALL